MDWIRPDIVIVHCSATPDFAEKEHGFDKFGAEDINKWHIERGFKKIGYHSIIRRTGEIQDGRMIDIARGMVELGAHCKSENSHSIGICYIGTKQPTTAQIESFKSLFIMIKTVFGIHENCWFPHNYFKPTKICPGFDIQEIFKNLPKY